MFFDSIVRVGWAGYGCVGGLSYLGLSLEGERQLMTEVPDSRNSLLILFSFKGTGLAVVNRRHKDKNGKSRFGIKIPRCFVGAYRSRL